MILVRDIVCAVARMCQVSETSIYSMNRKRKYTFPRFMAYYFCRKITKLSLPRLGLAFGGRDHTSVLHGVQRMEAHIQQILDWDEVEQCFIRMLMLAISDRKERQRINGTLPLVSVVEGP